MPFLKNDGTVVTDLAVATSKDYDYNLALHNSYGLSIQLVYSNQTSLNAVISIQVSNNGINFTDVPNTAVTITANGSTVWDLSNSAFKIVRVHYVRTAGTVDLTLTYNSLNLA